MSLWTLPPLLSALIADLAAWLDRRTAERFWSVVFGVLLCREKRRTAAAWFRAAGIGADFRRAYAVLGSVGRRVRLQSLVLLRATEQIGGGPANRYVFALDDPVTKRYGPCVEATNRCGPRHTAAAQFGPVALDRWSTDHLRRVRELGGRGAACPPDQTIGGGEPHNISAWSFGVMVTLALASPGLALTAYLFATAPVDRCRRWIADVSPVPFRAGYCTSNSLRIYSRRPVTVFSPHRLSAARQECGGCGRTGGAAGRVAKQRGVRCAEPSV